MTRPILTHPDMPLSERMHRLRNLQVLEGTQFNVEQADTELANACREIESYRMAVLTNMPTSDIRSALRRVVRHVQTALVLYSKAERDMGTEQRREVRIR